MLQKLLLGGEVSRILNHLGLSTVLATGGCVQGFSSGKEQGVKWIEANSMLEIDAKQTGDRWDVGDAGKGTIK